MASRYLLFLLLGLTGLSCSRNEPTPTPPIAPPAAAALPAALFTYSGKLESGQPIAFRNTSLNAQTYSWNFGDGTALSTDPQPTHTFSKVGTYAVKLTATGPGGADAAITYLVVSPPDTLAVVFAGLIGEYRFTKRISGLHFSFGPPIPATVSACDVPAQTTRPGVDLLSLTFDNQFLPPVTGKLSSMPPSSPYYTFSWTGTPPGSGPGAASGGSVKFKAGTDSIEYYQYSNPGAASGGYSTVTYYGKKR